MAMKLGGRRAAYDEINITPMLDLAYVLLIIFIIMTTASVQGIKTNLPKASSSAQLDSKSKAITVADTGEVYFEAYPVTMTELEQRLREQQALDPEVNIVVKGDTAVQYGKVIEVLDLLRRLDLNKVGLVTGKPGKS
ncbi:biopolymer transporter ExbD [Sphingomonas sp. KR3-1]|uniref:ExbD/TolR family protein n=1 Tax=Sphingomonas sp. KR3-1 TaxID=3156611 RepID=UPI0032B316D1